MAIALLLSPLAEHSLIGLSSTDLAFTQTYMSDEDSLQEYKSLWLSLDSKHICITKNVTESK